MADYISREAALSCFHDWIDRYGHEHSADEMTEYQRIEELPAADVRPVAEISDAVDEVLDFLNENYNRMPYHIYSALFDLVCGICPNCGADMRPYKDGRRGENDSG